MDAVSRLLGGSRAREAFVLRSRMEPPWSIRIQDEAPLALVLVLSGGLVVVDDDGTVHRIGAGDAAVLRGPQPYTMADDPATGPQVVIHPGQRCTTADGTEVKLIDYLGVRDWGNSAAGGTEFLTGVYEVRSEISRPLLAALPERLVLCGEDWSHPLVGVLAEEVTRDAPGQDAVLDRLLDVLLVVVLRAWFARPEAEAPAWYRAQGDPVVGPVLRLIEQDPARPWTVAELATAAGTSRAGLARRFTELVGEPPMTYLTDYRLGLAADLLREPGATVGSVARAVGYGSPFALSSAFKRVRGVSPQQHRAAALA